jgi:hypothetical protein
MTGTELAKVIHQAVSGITGAFELALESVAGEAQMLRARVEDLTKHLANAAKERSEIVDVLPKGGTGTLAEQIKQLVDAVKLPEGYQNASKHESSDENGATVTAYVVLHQDQTKDSIVLHLPIDHASDLLQKSRGNCSNVPIALAKALNAWRRDRS